MELRDGLSSWNVRSLFEIYPYDDRGPHGSRQFLIQPPTKQKQIQHYAALELDLSMDGNSELLVFEWIEHSWRGFNYAVRIFPSSQRDETKELLKAGTSIFSEHFENGVLLAEALWAPPLFVETASGIVYVDFPGWPDVLHRVTSSGAIQVCEVETLPEVRLGPAGFIELPEPDLSEILRSLYPSESDMPATISETLNATTSSVQAPPHLSKLLHNAYLSQGREQCGGTLHSHQTLQRSSAQNILNFVFRPWALPKPTNSRHTISKALQNWSYTDPWSRRVFLNILNAYALASAELKHRLQNEYDFEGSETLLSDAADQLLYRVLGLHYAFPSSRGEAKQFAPLSPRLETIQSIYEGRVSPEDIESRTSDTNPDYANVTDPELLLAALDQPTLLRVLIRLGSDANATNRFGKTPLMYAAQLNYFETAALLLNHDADVNAQTSTGDTESCNPFPQIGSRTALTYALENASADMIQLLLEAGARAPKMLGDTPTMDLLSMNTRLSSSEREQFRLLLKPVFHPVTPAGGPAAE